MIQLSHPAQIVYETHRGREVLLCEEQSLVSMDFETDADLTEEQNVTNEFARCSSITFTTANRLINWYRVQTGRHHITQLVFRQIEFAQLLDVGPPRRGLRAYRHEEPKPVDEPLSDDEVQILQQNLINHQKTLVYCSCRYVFTIQVR